MNKNKIIELITKNISKVSTIAELQESTGFQLLERQIVEVVFSKNQSRKIEKDCSPEDFKKLLDMCHDKNRLGSISDLKMNEFKVKFDTYFKEEYN